MRKAFRHTGVLMMVGVVALGLLGAAYTLWYEDLQLTATVSTGTFDADLSLHDLTAAPDDNEGRPVVAQVGLNPPTVATLLHSNVQANYDLFGAFPTNKPATTCDAELSSFGTVPANANDAVDDNLLELTMTGLYPYAGCEYEIDFHNDGTVPLHAAITSVTLLECTPGIDNILGTPDDVCSSVAAAPWSIGLDPSQTDLAQCVAALGAIATFSGAQQIQDSEGPLQLHENDEVVCRFKLILDQDPDAENKLYKFAATYRAYQWNEAPFGP